MCEIRKQWEYRSGRTPAKQIGCTQGSHIEPGAFFSQEDFLNGKYSIISHKLEAVIP